MECKSTTAYSLTFLLDCDNNLPDCTVQRSQKNTRATTMYSPPPHPKKYPHQIYKLKISLCKKRTTGENKSSKKMCSPSFTLKWLASCHFFIIHCLLLCMSIRWYSICLGQLKKKYVLSLIQACGRTACDAEAGLPREKHGTGARTSS